MRSGLMGKKVLSIFLSLMILFGFGSWTNLLGQNVYALTDDDNVISNPTPVIDIAVNVPADYPGTFLDFKAELEEKLIAQGLDPKLFRITSSAIKIDTTNTEGWYVYDHYYNQKEYEKLNLSEAQKKVQPFRQADTTYDTGNLSGIVNIEDVFVNNKYGSYPNRFTRLWRFNRHIYSWKDSAGKSNMVFAGYGTKALVDYMLYPATSNSRRTFSFDMDASKIGNHTLEGAGFLMNAGMDNDTLKGYMLYYTNINTTSGQGSANVAIKEVNFKPSTISNTDEQKQLAGVVQ